MGSPPLTGHMIRGIRVTKLMIAALRLYLFVSALTGHPKATSTKPPLTPRSDTPVRPFWARNQSWQQAPERQSPAATSNSYTVDTVVKCKMTQSDFSDSANGPNCCRWLSLGLESLGPSLNRLHTVHHMNPYITNCSRGPEASW